MGQLAGVTRPVRRVGQPPLRPLFAMIAATGGITAAIADITKAAVTEKKRTMFQATTIRAMQVPIRRK